MTAAFVPLDERLAIGDSSITYRYVAPQSFGDDDRVAVVRTLDRAFNGRPSWFDYGKFSPADRIAEVEAGFCSAVQKLNRRLLTQLGRFRHIPHSDGRVRHRR